MENSKYIAGFAGPVSLALTVTEAFNHHIWASNIAPNVYLNGAVLFTAGLAIVRAHNVWIFAWPVLVTLMGWFAFALGLSRMAWPQAFVTGAQTGSPAMFISGEAFLGAVGLFLTYKAYIGAQK